MDPPLSEPTPWWLVPNVLALDAPLVAVAWQRFLAARFGVTVPWAATVALAAAVWGVYLADRLLDARRGALDAERHRLAARYPLAFAVGFLLAGGVAVVAAARLPVWYSWTGLDVGLGVVAYLALVHVAAGSVRRVPGAKELLVGIGFAAGVAIPLGHGGEHFQDWLPSVVAFGGLCWLNCRLIDHWEAPAPAHPAWSDGVLGGALVVGSVALPLAVGLAVAGAVLGLLAVHVGFRHRPRAARVLADAVLLTPLAVWAIP